MTSSHLTNSISSISKLTANVFSILLESPRAAAITDNFYIVSDSLDLIREIAKTIERDWISCPLANAVEPDIAPDSKELSKSIWTTLKTFLFVCVMLSEAVLSTLVYLPPQPCDITPATLALQTLYTLSHLSFVISQFGGVTTSTQGFEQLKKTFYLSLDILAQTEGESEGVCSKAEAYVQQICLLVNSQSSESGEILSLRRLIELTNT